MWLQDLVYSLTFPPAPQRKPHIVLQELVQGVHRYAGYPVMAKLYAEKAKTYALEQQLMISNEDQKLISKYK